jgi:dTDP-4-dehydrorhamnose 3,5-epimerase
MLFESLQLAGAVLVRLDRHEDERGFFARTVCAEEFRARGLPDTFVQSSTSWNRRRGTLRGLHFQWPPSHEGKLVRCVRGAICDVLLDLRPAQPTYLQHQAVTLDDDNREAVFVPAGVAHGFQTLADSTEVLYQMSDVHLPALAGGVRWNDASFGIRWPLSGDIVIAERDASWPDFARGDFEAELARRSAAPGAEASWT